MPDVTRNHDAHDYAERFRERLPRRHQEQWEGPGLGMNALARGCGSKQREQAGERLWR